MEAFAVTVRVNGIILEAHNSPLDIQVQLCISESFIHVINSLPDRVVVVLIAPSAHIWCKNLGLFPNYLFP